MIKDFIALIYPNLCLACENPLVKGENQICTTCNFSFAETDFHLNDFSTSSDNQMLQKFYGKVPMKHALAYFHYKKSTRIQKVLHKLKYKEAKELGEMYGEEYGQLLYAQGFTNKFDVLIPVPLHKNKLRKRGFNQAEMIANGLAKSLQLPVDIKLLVRNVYTETQTKKSRVDRWKNVQEVFAVPDKSILKDKNVLIVDDVITTGSTIEACAIPILRAGARSVSVVCLAVAD